MYSVEQAEKERVLLVGLAKSSKERWEKRDSLEELEILTKTSRGEVVEKFLQIKPSPSPSYFIGKGKVSFLKSIVKNLKIDIVIFDDPLNLTQIRNLEKELGVRVIDRTGLILDIFALHAHSAEAKVQVELAQLNYRLTHLTGKGIEMSRLGGGIGTRGPGEKKLEVDRRSILARIKTLKKKLKEIEKEREIQRKRRKNILRVTLAGYTNAGKSTLFNLFTKSKIYVSPYLFSTLDSTSRVLFLDGNIPVCITDTVGFIKNLPTQLIASFKATLKEIIDSTLILHIIDASHPRHDEMIEVVEKQLEELGIKDTPIIKVFNKEDILSEIVKERIRRKYHDAIFVSALYGTGIEKLKEKIKEYLSPYIVERKFVIPQEKQNILHLLYESGCILSKKETNEKVEIKIKGYKPFIRFIEKIL